jgi:hypothetical protein
MYNALVTPIATNFIAPFLRSLALIQEQPLKVAAALSMRSDAPKLYTLSDSYYAGEVMNIADNPAIGDYIQADVQIYTAILTYLASNVAVIPFLSTPVTGFDTWPIQIQNISPPSSPTVLRSRKTLLTLITSMMYMKHPLAAFFTRLVSYQSNGVVYGITMGVGDAVALYDAANAPWRVNANTITTAPNNALKYVFGIGFRNAIMSDLTFAGGLGGSAVNAYRNTNRSIILVGTPGGSVNMTGDVFIPDVIAGTNLNNAFRDFKLHEEFLEFVDRMPRDISARALAVISQLSAASGVVLVAPSWVNATPQAVIQAALGVGAANLNLAFSLAYLVILVVMRYWLELITVRPEYAILNKTLSSSIEGIGLALRQ